MEEWQKIYKDSLNNFDELKIYFKLKGIEVDNHLTEFPVKLPLRINKYYLDLIQSYKDPIWRQCIPDSLELTDNVCIEDPLGEEQHSPTPNLVHKYPDRALLLVTNQCGVYCRFCTRNRMVGTDKLSVTNENLEKCYEYLRNTPEVREVLISGGDPLLLSDERINDILSNLRKISTIEVIRIGSRVPCTLPMRITPKLVSILKQYHPLYINTHFNHPRELTLEASIACEMLADGGIPLGCQTVLLKGVNDNSETLKQLFLGLLKMRVKPYYLFQTDLTKGTDHFRTRTTDGIKIMKELYGFISGMAIPRFALDAPGGKGKIPLSPEYIKQYETDKLIFKNYLGELTEYPEVIDYL